MILDERDLETIEPRRIFRKFEPVTHYDYCKVYASVTGFPIGKFLRDCKGWPMNWHYDLQSLCKEKDKVTQAKTIWWFIRESKGVEKSD